MSSPIINNYRTGSLAPGVYSLDHAVSQGVDRVVLYGRVSALSSLYSGRLDEQLQPLEDECAELGIEVVDQRAGHERGFLDDPRTIFRSSIKLAKRERCPILARALNRYLRPRHFQGQANQLAEPKRDELDELIDLAGVPLITLFDPNLNASEVHGETIRRGKNKPGRPKAIDDDLAELIAGDLQAGLSKRKIAAQYGISRDAIETMLDSTYCGVDGYSWRDFIGGRG